MLAGTETGSTYQGGREGYASMSFYGNPRLLILYVDITYFCREVYWILFSCLFQVSRKIKQWASEDGCQSEQVRYDAFDFWGCLDYALLQIDTEWHIILDRYVLLIAVKGYCLSFLILPKFVYLSPSIVK